MMRLKVSSIPIVLLVALHLLSLTSAFTTPKHHHAHTRNPVFFLGSIEKQFSKSSALPAVLLPDAMENSNRRLLQLIERENHSRDPRDHHEGSTSTTIQQQHHHQQQQKGLMTIIGITFLFASNSPTLHAVFTADAAPPVLLVNAAISTVALLGLVFSGDVLESSLIPSPPSSAPSLKQVNNANSSSSSVQHLQAGVELGLWKFLGTTANLAGLSLTTANHGAFLIQLTTLIVPVVQSLMGAPLTKRTQLSVSLALLGVCLFTQDDGSSADVTSLLVESSSTLLTGDALCVAAACFYAAYDLRLFHWGKQVAPKQLITGKMATQSTLSLVLLATLGSQETVDYFTTMTTTSSYTDITLVLLAILWSGLAVNALAPLLQVEGQQALGPTRCQTIYASQPLWAAGMSFICLGETVGLQGMVGGLAFLVALFAAATTPPSQTASSTEDDENKNTKDEGILSTATSETTSPTSWTDLLHQMPPSRFGGGRPFSTRYSRQT